MQLEPVPTAGVRVCRRQENNPLVKGGAQHSACCDSHIKLCVLSSIQKSQQMGYLRTSNPMIGEHAANSIMMTGQLLD
eukprot:6301460-Ditylum_brightwellii.AAC.1